MDNIKILNTEPIVRQEKERNAAGGKITSPYTLRLVKKRVILKKRGLWKSVNLFSPSENFTSKDCSKIVELRKLKINQEHTTQEKTWWSIVVLYGRFLNDATQYARINKRVKDKPSKFRYFYTLNVQKKKKKIGK